MPWVFPCRQGTFCLLGHFWFFPCQVEPKVSDEKVQGTAASDGSSLPVWAAQPGLVHLADLLPALTPQDVLSSLAQKGHPAY